MAAKSVLSFATSVSNAVTLSDAVVPAAADVTEASLSNLISANAFLIPVAAGEQRPISLDSTKQ